MSCLSHEALSCVLQERIGVELRVCETMHENQVQIKLHEHGETDGEVLLQFDESLHGACMVFTASSSQIDLAFHLLRLLCLLLALPHTLLVGIEVRFIDNILHLTC